MGKRLDVNVTDTLAATIEDLQAITERSKTEIVHDAIGLLDWAKDTYQRDHIVAEVDPDTGGIIMGFLMPMFQIIKVKARRGNLAAVVPASVDAKSNLSIIKAKAQRGNVPHSGSVTESKPRIGDKLRNELTAAVERAGEREGAPDT